MTGRKQRRNVNNDAKPVKGAGRKLLFMIISIAFMVFCIFQVYYLTKYTLGHEISSDKMAVYTWIKKLTSKNDNPDIQN